MSKRSNSARLRHCSKLTASKTKQFCELPQYFNLTTSKTKQFCETSSFFEVDNIKNERILRDFLQEWKVACRADGLVPIRFAIFPVSVQTTVPATKKWCQAIRSAAPVTQNHLGKPEDLMLQNATPHRKSPPGPPNSSDENVSSTAPATENASLQILFKCPTPAIVFGHATKPSRFARFWEGAQSLAPATRKHIWTSKSGTNIWCFVHFEMCFAPQRRALFRHLNFQKWSEHGVLCIFWLRNVLRATKACTFSTSQLPKVVRAWCVLYILTSKCASSHNGVHFFDISTSKSGPKLVCFVLLTWKRALRHNGVQFFISHLPSGLRTRRFSEPTFRPSGATNHWKNMVFRDFPTFSRTWIFFLLTLSLLWSSLFYSSLLFSLTLPISAFHLSMLSEVWLLNFLRSWTLWKIWNSVGMIIPNIWKKTKCSKPPTSYILCQTTEWFLGIWHSSKSWIHCLIIVGH